MRVLGVKFAVIVPAEVRVDGELVISEQLFVIPPSIVRRLFAGHAEFDSFFFVGSDRAWVPVVPWRAAVPFVVGFEPAHFFVARLADFNFDFACSERQACQQRLGASDNLFEGKFKNAAAFVGDRQVGVRAGFHHRVEAAVVRVGFFVFFVDQVRVQEPSDGGVFEANQFFCFSQALASVNFDLGAALENVFGCCRGKEVVFFTFWHHHAVFFVDINRAVFASTSDDRGC